MRPHLPIAGCLAALLGAPSSAPAQQPPASAPATTAAAAPTSAPKAATPTAASAPKAAAGKAAKPAGKAGKKKKQPKDAPVTGPVATYPGFRMLDGGGSRVLVALSKKVNVTEQKSDGKLTYRIQGMQVPTRTNRLPLLTTFFATPVSRATLVTHDNDVDLVIELRTASTPQFRVIETDKGAELQVDFPKVATEAAADAAPEKAAAPAPAGRPATAKSLDSKSETAY